MTTRSSSGVQRALQHIDRHLAQPLSLAELAGIAGLSIWRFATVFRQKVGMSPHRYICSRRVERAQLLIRSGVPAASAASEAGFYDQSHFLRHFKNLCGMTPGQSHAHGARFASGIEANLQALKERPLSI